MQGKADIYTPRQINKLATADLVCLTSGAKDNIAISSIIVCNLNRLDCTTE